MKRVSNRDVWSNSFSNARHNDRTVQCRNCKRAIQFSQKMGKKGKLIWIPVELDGSTHTCYKK